MLLLGRALSSEYDVTTYSSGGKFLNTIKHDAEVLPMLDMIIIDHVLGDMNSHDVMSVVDDLVRRRVESLVVLQVSGSSTRPSKNG